MISDEHPAAAPPMVAVDQIPGTPPPRPGWVTWFGLAIVLTAAAVLSFSALRNIAVDVGIATELAWLLPVSVDGGLAVSTRAWLSRRVNPEAEAFARRMTYSLILLTIAGNAAQLGMAAHGVIPPWPVAVAVGAIAPSIVACAVHLLVLCSRTPAIGLAYTEYKQDEQPDPVPVSVPAGEGDQPAGRPYTAHTAVAQLEPARANGARATRRTKNGTKRTDDQLIAELRDWTADEGTVPSRRRVMDRYSVGTERADRLRAAAQDGASDG